MLKMLPWAVVNYTFVRIWHSLQRQVSDNSFVDWGSVQPDGATIMVVDSYQSLGVGLETGLKY